MAGEYRLKAPKPQRFVYGAMREFRAYIKSMDSPSPRDYWDQVADAKQFHHPLRIEWRASNLAGKDILDCGCGYASGSSAAQAPPRLYSGGNQVIPNRVLDQFSICPYV